MLDLIKVLTIMAMMVAVLVILIWLTWLIVRSRFVRNPIIACMVAAGALCTFSQFPAGRIFTDWPDIVVFVLAVGLPIGLVWHAEEQYQRKLSAEDTAP